MEIGTAAAVGPGASPAIRRYMNGEIDATEYLREVSEDTARQVERELDTREESAPTERA
jgi:hypothetical protein